MLHVDEAALQEKTSGNTTRKRKQANRLLTRQQFGASVIVSANLKQSYLSRIFSRSVNAIGPVSSCVSTEPCHVYFVFNYIYKIMTHRKAKTHLSRSSSQPNTENSSLSLKSRVVRRPFRTFTDAVHTNTRAQIDTSCDHRVIWPLAFTVYVVVPIPL